MLGEAFSYCLSALREADRDRYVACLLMPEAIRADMAALYLFDAETARIRDLVHEPMPGEIRLQWWRDVIEADGSAEDSGPLAQALKDVIARNNLPKEPFINLLDARIFDLYNDPMGAPEDFELYAGETISSIMQLGLLICAPEMARQGAEVAGHAGVALGVARMLRQFAQHRSRGQVYIPISMLAAGGLDPETIVSAEIDRAKLANVLRIFAGFGQEHLEAARAALRGSNVPVWPFLVAASSGSVLKSAQSKGAAIIDKPFGPGPFSRQWSMWRSARRGII